MTDPMPPTAEAIRIEPPVSELTAPFWDATRRQRLVLQWCTDCDEAIFYPRDVCPACLGTDLQWRASEGRGTVYAVSVQHRAANPAMADRVPYAVVLVDLDDGIRLMSNVVDVDPATVEPGQAVTLCWEPLRDGRHLPQFRLA
ncbi:MAG: Zn-ribbon domain-containing OB-fold protein [Acidimicrobiales bacterium]